MRSTLLARRSRLSQGAALRHPMGCTALGVVERATVVSVVVKIAVNLRSDCIGSDGDSACRDFEPRTRQLRVSGSHCMAG